MRGRNSSLALATSIIVLAATAALDSASAQWGGDTRSVGRMGGGRYSSPQPNQRLPGAASRPSNRDLRTRPNIVGRALGDETQDPDGGGLGLDWEDDWFDDFNAQNLRGVRRR